LRDFTISKKSLLVLFSLIGLIVVAVFAFQNAGTFFPQPTPTVSPEEHEASAAVVAGVEAFFQVDYREGMDAWLERFCSVSSDAGCQFAKAGARGLWKRYEAVQTVTSAKATPLALIRETSNEQIWQVAIQLSKPLPGSEKTEEEAYAIAVQENGAWKFDRFLMEQEIEAIQKQTGQEN